MPPTSPVSQGSGGASAAEPRERWSCPPGVARVVVLATLATLALAAPVLRAPTQRLFGNEIVGRYHDPYTVALWFEHPRAPSLYTQPVTDYLGALVARITGGVAAYDFVVLASFPLAAWFAYLLAARIVRSRLAAALAALAYAFAPFHLAHAAYHPQVAQTHWLPLYFLALVLALERATLARLAFFAAALGLVSLSNFYGGLAAIVCTPPVGAAAWLARRQTEGVPEASRRPFAANLGRLALLVAGIAGAAFLYLRAFAPAVLERKGDLAFPAADLARYTARWASYLVPPVEHPLLGERARAYWERTTLPGDLLEHQLTIGLGLLALAAVAIAAWTRARLRGERSDDLRWVPGLALLAGWAFAFSLAPVWTLAGVAFRSPSGWLYRVLPMFRAHARFGFVVFLAVALLAALGFTLLLRSGRRPVVAAAVALVALAAFELTPFPPFRWRDVLPTESHRFLRDQVRPRETVRVLDCVAASDPAQRAVPALFGPTLAQLAPNGDCSEPGLSGKLAALGFSHLIVRRDSRDGELLARRGLPDGMRLERAESDSWLLAVDTPADEVYLEVGAGFFARQLHAERSYRWMGQRGTIQLVNRADGDRLVTLRLTLHAMPHPRRVLYTIGDGTTAELGIAGTEPASFPLGPLLLPRGKTTLRLATDEPAIVADDVLHNGDTRAVAVALWEWEIAAVKP